MDIKSDAELLWIEVQLKNQQKLLLSTFYRPSSSDDEYLKLFDAFLLDIPTHTANNPDHTIIVGGDFNLPDINWEHNCVSASSSKKKLHIHTHTYTHIHTYIAYAWRYQVAHLFGSRCFWLWFYWFSFFFWLISIRALAMALLVAMLLSLNISVYLMVSSSFVIFVHSWMMCS